MLRFLLLLAVTAPTLLLAGRIQLVNLSPEEAQKYITEQSLDLRYAKKLGEFPLGYFRNIQDPSSAKLFHKGRLIEHPEDYVEEGYEASQFHGQDGLGRAMFGYSDYNQARLEARNTNGEIRGSYQYIDPTGQEVIVQYWSDSLGFHQIDNRPEVKLEPVTDTPEVREARLAHEKAWKEAANLARSGKPISDINRPVHNGVEEEEEEIVAALSNQHQSLVRYPSLPYTSHISPEDASASSDDAVVVEADHNVKKRENVESNSNEEEPQYDPKGFFYSFEYPVFNIKETESGLARSQSQKVKRSNPQEELKVASELNLKGVPVAVPVPAVKSPVLPEAAPEPALGDNRVSLKAVLTGEQLVAAVHDVQVSPKQQLSSEQ
ncbi:uncharacterized protein LOC129767614 [Toxorhynchites rutilus septentrionalis]|uniref:uncharacterized protein LOC129767614 n=1 Tax=Toxorhynchites rutilus septentrionalis TaxID=329112 RepID=UPI00247854F3|nr:uncharacterized protein LOC129767614 [Toxorhynchites rutilus septentrionalis]